MVGIRLRVLFARGGGANGDLRKAVLNVAYGHCVVAGHGRTGPREGRVAILAIVGRVPFVGRGERIGLVQAEHATTRDTRLIMGFTDVSAHPSRLEHRFHAPSARVHVNVHLALEAL